MISIIVPAHNEARLLGATLHALQDAATVGRTPCELIVVDDASDDGTGDIARTAGARVVRVECRHIAAARNTGAAHAQGRWLLFVDADTHVGAATLAAAVQALEQGAVGGGARVSLHGTAAWYERVVEAVLGLAFRWARIAPGCFLFCTRAAFDAAGGFDMRFYAGEDVALSRALGRIGRFVILRQPVHTSDRKLRTFSAWEHVMLLLRFLWRRQRLLTSREHLHFWYGKRRD